MGIMGYSLCAAVAASQLHPDEQKVVVVGDGGFQMSLQELATLRDHWCLLTCLGLRLAT